MARELWDFILNSFKNISGFAEWLTTKLPYVNISPLAIFGVAGFSAIMILHLIHLVNVVSG